MIYIKLDEDMELGITVNGPIRRGDNLSNKITYLIPTTLNEVNMLGAIPYLCYIRADGTPDIVRLDRSDEMYKDKYYQYTVPVTCKLTRYPGEVCTWIEVFSGTPSHPTIAKSGECTLFVEDAKNIDDCLCDSQISALYQMQKEMEQNMSSIGESIDGIASDVAKKADGLSYDKETRKLGLTANGEPIAETVTVPSDDYMDDAKESVEDTWGDMTDDTGTDGSEAWEEM